MCHFLSVRPKNPRHFVALCFIELRSDARLRDSHQFMKKRREEASRALFECAYGFFWAAKDGNFSKEFYPTKDLALKGVGLL